MLVSYDSGVSPKKFCSLSCTVPSPNSLRSESVFVPSSLPVPVYSASASSRVKTREPNVRSCWNPPTRCVRLNLGGPAVPRFVEMTMTPFAARAP